MRRWWLDEIAHAGDEHLDVRYVAGYDRKAGFDPAEDIDALRPGAWARARRSSISVQAPAPSLRRSHPCAARSSPWTSRPR
jgi:hypothetical protein